MSNYDDDGFQGSEPQVFTGDRSQAESFMTQWYIYTAVNDFVTFMPPSKITMLFLTYVKGPLVNTWVQQQARWLREQIARGEDEENMANTVKRRFEETFVDNLKKERARATLRAGVFMEEYQVDEYVATFEELIRHAGYEYSTPQTIDKFAEGIPFALMEKCMTYDRPTTYNEWKTSLEKRVQLQLRMEASRPELSLRHRRSFSPVPSLEYEDDSEPEEVEEYLEEAPPQEPIGYGEEYDEAAYDAPPEEEEQEYTIPEDAFEEELLVLRPSRQVKRGRPPKKQVRFNERTEEFEPPAEAREEYFTPLDLEVPPPPPLPTPWSQQVEAARQEVVNPTTWGHYQFHPEAMDTSARGRVRMMRELVVCHHCHQEGHIRPVCPNRHKPRARWPRECPAALEPQSYFGAGGSLYAPTIQAAPPIPVVPPPKKSPPPSIGILKPRKTAAEHAAEILKELDENPELHEELDRSGALERFMEAEMRGHPKELRVPVTFVTTKGTLTISALVDSGATINTMAPLLARRLGLEVQQYALPKPLVNADGSWSRNGVVREYTKLSVTADNHYTEMDFTLMDSAVDLMLGNPWLHHFEPQINWKAATLDEKYWPTVRNIYTDLQAGPSNVPRDLAVQPATSVRELAYNATIAARIPRRESRAWGPCLREEGNVTYTPRDIPAIPPTRIGRLEDLDITEDMPNEAEERLWTHGDDEEDEATVRAVIEAAEDPEEAFKQRLYCGSAYVEEIMDD